MGHNLTLIAMDARNLQPVQVGGPAGWKCQLEPDACRLGAG